MFWVSSKEDLAKFDYRSKVEKLRNQVIFLATYYNLLSIIYGNIKFFSLECGDIGAILFIWGGGGML